MRGEYLFDLAHVCHMDACQVDALRYYDFCNYILRIDDYYEQRKQQLNAMNNQG